MMSSDRSAEKGTDPIWTALGNSDCTGRGNYDKMIAAGNTADVPRDGIIR